MQGERQDVDFPVAEKNDVVKLTTSFSVWVHWAELLQTSGRNFSIATLWIRMC